MGEVYRAHDAVLAREVAIKVLHRSLAGDPGFVDRFRREARAAAGLSHPNIVAVYDWGASDGIYFMVMEFVRGRNVRELLQANGKLEPAQVADVLLPVLAALAHAHEQGIVHRDVKPENVLVTRDGIAKVADFGLARAYAESRATQAGTVTGTVQYLAPEQVRGEPADPRTDVYSLGVVAYELLTGVAPFRAETSVAVAHKHLTERVPAPSAAVPAVPQVLDDFVLRTTERDRDARPSAAELRRPLAQAAPLLPDAVPLEELVRGLPDPSAPGPERAPTVTIRSGHSRIPWRAGRILRRWFAIALLLGAIGTGAWAIWAFIVPHYARVPPVLGLSQTSARQRLADAGLAVTIGRDVYSVRYEAGEVAEVDPSEGVRLRENSPVVLHLSRGPRSVEVPSLERMTVAEAKAALTQVNLELGRRKTVYSSDIPKGNIVFQKPPANDTVDSGSRVNVRVSQGPAPVEVPALADRAAGDATTLLRGLGLDVRRVERYSSSVDAGDVIKSAPGTPVILHDGDSVTLYVSRGPRNFQMPDVLGMSTAAATAALKDKGLSVSVSVVPNSGGANVVSQSPRPGTAVSAGDHVTIYVA